MFRTETLRTNLGASNQGAAASSDFAGIQSGLRANLGQTISTEFVESSPLIQGAVRRNVGVNSFANLVDVTTAGLQPGQVMFWQSPFWVPGNAIREVLTSNRTYYVRTDGSDSNSGLSDTSGGSFLTIQKAIDVACSLDCTIYTPTIQLGDGTFTLASPIELKRFLGTKAVIKGNSSTPSNVVIQGPGDVIQGIGTKGCRWELRGFKLQSSTSSGSARALIFLSNADVDIYNLNFGAMAGGSFTSRHMNVTKHSLVRVMSGYTISGGANMHVLVETQALVDFRDAEPGGAVTVTLTGTPDFPAGSFWWAASKGQINCFAGGGGLSFSGTATGVRYNGYYNALILTNGGATTFPPGNVAGFLDATSVYA